MNASENIDARIRELNDWRGEVYATLRKLVSESDPDIQEDWKWGTAVWIKNGLVCAVSAFKDHVKINFFKGAYLKDQHRVINNGFDSKEHRAIDFCEGDKINETAVQDLVKEAVALNTKR